jgi:hypothetical protein
MTLACRRKNFLVLHVKLQMKARRGLKGIIEFMAQFGMWMLFMTRRVVRVRSTIILLITSHRTL